MERKTEKTSKTNNQQARNFLKNEGKIKKLIKTVFVSYVKPLMRRTMDKELIMDHKS